MRKWLIVSGLISLMHFLEDFALVLIGRYTTVHIGIILCGVILFGVVIGSISRMSKVKKFLGE